MYKMSLGQTFIVKVGKTKCCLHKVSCDAVEVLIEQEAIKYV